MRYDETTLTKWTEKLSQTEDERAKNARNMIYDAIQSSKELNKYDIDVFTQGSYANNTNVRSDSDIDICIMCKDVFNLILPEGKTIEDYGFEESNYSFLEYRNQIKRALQNKFGIESVTDGNKSIKIKENTYHVKADVVPSFQFRNYYYENSFEPNRYIEGVWFQANTGEVVINYPKRHKDNGTDKNKESNYLYKKLVRIMKHIKNEMVEDKKADGDKITSFLVECLVYQVPNRVITEYDTWTETVKQSIIYLYNEIRVGHPLEWCEVSDMLYLFRNRKWTYNDALQWLAAAWNYLGYGK